VQIDVLLNGVFFMTGWRARMIPQGRGGGEHCLDWRAGRLARRRPLQRGQAAVIVLTECLAPSGRSHIPQLRVAGRDAHRAD
jgi:hypothetical protein